MATVLGAGSLLGTSLGGMGPGAAWFRDSSLPPASGAAGSSLGEGRALASFAAAARETVDPPETLDLLARVVWVLGNEAAGLSLSDLRAHLSESAEPLQRALGAGLRTKRLRRVGAHNKLRYVLNS